jgi:hypothetical protein
MEATMEQTETIVEETPAAEPVGVLVHRHACELAKLLPKEAECRPSLERAKVERNKTVASNGHWLIEVDHPEGVESLEGYVDAEGLKRAKKDAPKKGDVAYVTPTQDALGFPEYELAKFSGEPIHTIRVSAKYLKDIAEFLAKGCNGTPVVTIEVFDLDPSSGYRIHASGNPGARVWLMGCSR